MIGLCVPRGANVRTAFDAAAGVIVYDMAFLGFQVNEIQV
jgi:hypothetical protein